MDGWRYIVQRFLTDAMDIYRHESVTNDDGTEDTVLPDTPKHFAVPCLISFPSMESAQDSEIDEVRVRYQVKIFCDIETDIREGDYVVAIRTVNGVQHKYEGIAGLPNVYPNHIEFLISIDRST